MGSFRKTAGEKGCSERGSDSEKTKREALAVNVNGRPVGEIEKKQ